jgi:signal transduction histidine kinase
MFKQLRNGILDFNMVITSVVMILAFAAVFFITAANIQANNEHALVNAPSLALTVDDNGTVQQTFSSLDIPESEYRDAVAYAWEHRENTSFERTEFAGRTWLYAVSYAETLVTSLDSDGIIDFEPPTSDTKISFLDISDSLRTLQDLLLTFLAVGIVMVVVIFLISRYFANRAMRPVVEAWDRQRRFVADASHELRTPLAIISANYDALLMNREETIESQSEWLDYMRFGMDRMTKLTNDLLMLNTVEDTAIGVRLSDFDIGAVVEEVVASMEPLAKEKGIEPQLSIAPGIVVHSDRALVEQVVSVLYENALKYTEQDGTIKVSLTATGGHISCTVKNTGEGIDPEALSHIFDRFYRADASRNSETSGYGLGLSIAKSIAEKLGGDLVTESRQNGWTTFTFTFKA